VPAQTVGLTVGVRTENEEGKKHKAVRGKKRCKEKRVDQRTTEPTEYRDEEKTDQTDQKLPNTKKSPQNPGTGGASNMRRKDKTKDWGRSDHQDQCHQAKKRPKAKRSTVGKDNRAKNQTREGGRDKNGWEKKRNRKRSGLEACGSEIPKAESERIRSHCQAPKKAEVANRALKHEVRGATQKLRLGP